MLEDAHEAETVSVCGVHDALVAYDADTDELAHDDDIVSE